MLHPGILGRREEEGEAHGSQVGVLPRHLHLEALALSTDHVGLSKWHLLCLILVFRYKLFLVLKRTTAPEGTRIPKESDEAIPSGLEIDDTDIKFNIITKEALAEMNVYKISGAAQGNCRPCG